MTMIVTRTNY